MNACLLGHLTKSFNKLIQNLLQRRRRRRDVFKITANPGLFLIYFRPLLNNNSNLNCKKHRCGT